MDYRRLNEDSEGFYDRQIWQDTGKKVRPVDVVDGDLVIDNRFYAARRGQIRALTASRTPGYAASRKRDLRPYRANGTVRSLRREY